MSPFYTRTGDDGYTGLLGKGRVPKYHPLTEAIGTLDEANAAFGMARAACKTGQVADILLVIQRDLYNLMAEVSTSPENAARFRTINDERVIWLESKTEQVSELVELPNEFIVPGDTTAGAALDLARAVVRRAERRVAELVHNGMIENNHLLKYLNRLSSLCFVLELLENKTGGKSNPTLAKG